VAATSAQFSLVLRVRIAHQPGMLGQVASAIGHAGGTIGSVDLIAHDGEYTLRDITVDTSGEEHGNAIVAAVAAIEGAEVVDTTDRTFLMHVGGKIEQRNKYPLKTRDDLSMAYTPGVARVAPPSRRTATRPSSTRSSATRWRSSPTAARCWASATSAPRPRCP